VAALFKAMGMEVMTTTRTGDGGVDVQAMDPDPVRGGKLVIEVKWYRNTIPPAHVRDLYGTMLHEGATKGIFVTTAEFGPSAQELLPEASDPHRRTAARRPASPLRDQLTRCHADKARPCQSAANVRIIKPRPQRQMSAAQSYPYI
jgi:hypothetical protein